MRTLNHSLIIVLMIIVSLLVDGIAAQGTRDDALHNNLFPFLQEHCVHCHDQQTKTSGLDLESIAFKPTDSRNFATWVKVFDRVMAGEMPPKEETRPDENELKGFTNAVESALMVADQKRIVLEGRATQRRLNGYEYENALRDLLSAPWLQIKGQFPVDGEALAFNKIGDALDVSHVHMARYMSAADYALRQAISVRFEQPPTTTTRFYARDQRTLTGKLRKNFKNGLPDRNTFLLLGTKPQLDGAKNTPLTVGDVDPTTRDLEAVGWVSSVYMAGFRYRWDGFRAPVAGRYRIRFSGYTLWVEPDSKWRSSIADKVTNKNATNDSIDDEASEADKLRVPVTVGRRDEPMTVYTRNGVMNSRVGQFDLTPVPSVHDIGEVWLHANETLVPDASRFFRSRPPNFENPLKTEEGRPGVALRWMEVEGPLYDDSTTAGYRLLFDDLPIVKVAGNRPGLKIPVVDRAERRPKGGEPAELLSEIKVDIVSKDPKKDAERLMRRFIARAYRQPIDEIDVQLFLDLVEQRLDAGLSFAEAMIAGYTAVLGSPGFVFLNEKPGTLNDYSIATRLALFLWNSVPDAALRARANRGELSRPDVLRAETERMLNDPKARQFVEAFLDYWIDLRKIDDSTPSTSLYNDYYLDDALTEAALAETRLFFTEMVQRDLPVRNVVDSDFTFVNERLAAHYGIPDVKGIAMRRLTLPGDSPRGGIMTQASVLKVTANGTTTSPVLRGKWIMERILGYEIPPPPPVAAVEPDIRGAVTIRQQLAKHRDDPSCASCHSKIDPAGFALESFDVMGAWRDRYRAVDEKTPPEKGIGKNGHNFEFHFGLPVDATGELPDGRPFQGIRDFKRLVREDEAALGRNLAMQLTVYATGAPLSFADRPEVEAIVRRASAHHYGLRSLIHEVIQSSLFLNK
ncbi:MAG: DUF1592 domain-containing protein [Planctomycetota bacterium]|nr:DUF1592 domain-containing protein [Planctomycetota bacterium]